MNIRLAEMKDLKQLIKMRWDFTIEYDESKRKASYEEFEKECHAFLVHAINQDTWFIWVAEEDGVIISHIYIELIHKVPRPGRVTRPFAYLTNTYTLPSYRKKGIGSKVLQAIHSWVDQQQYEFVFVWPSDESIDYYRRNGYEHCSEPMEYVPFED
ncbi:GNAT family N-acetyltransferase [Halalkalibacillus halophilus]|uniref:GNAT family N-acetyltransferase n=1 Tax=Halalkalibacillus halophilus TaxID=392827 RepID=UPI000429F0DA|nr:GNAT family N-acetyltransferase [Halalkalibacillus halophilus]